MRRDPLPTAPAGPTAVQLLQAALDRLSGLPEALRQTLTDHQWSLIPLFVDENVYAPAQPSGSPLYVKAQTSGLEQITSIVATIPEGATGTIQLGSMVIPISEGTTVIAPVQKLLATSDTRCVTFIAGDGQPSAGPCALWLTGQQLPTYGVLAK